MALMATECTLLSVSISSSCQVELWLKSKKILQCQENFCINRTHCVEQLGKQSVSTTPLPIALCSKYCGVTLVIHIAI